MDDIESKINAIFSSPESMEQIRSLAKALSGGEAQPPGESGSSTTPGPDPQMMQLLTRVMGEYSKPSEATAILTALRPYLSPERAQKLDRAMSIARLARLAGTVLPEFGGERHV